MRRTSDFLLLFVVLSLLHPSSAELRFTQFLFSDSVGESVVLIDDGSVAMLVDTSRTGFTDGRIADEVAIKVEELGVTLKSLFITHGHPDHFSGVPALKNRFDGIDASVADQRIKDELISFAELGFLTPELSAYDWDGEIQVYDSPTITLFGEMNPIEITVDDLPAESTYYSLLWVPNDRVLFSGDVFYNREHLYLGPGMNLATVNNWRKKTIPRILDQFGDADLIFPGHGVSADDIAALAKENQQYLDFFVNELLTCNAEGTFPTVAELEAALLTTYNGYGATDLVSFMSFNEDVWAADQEEEGCNAAGKLVATHSFMAIVVVFALLASTLLS